MRHISTTIVLTSVTILASLGGQALAGDPRSELSEIVRLTKPNAAHRQGAPTIMDYLYNTRASILAVGGGQPSAGRTTRSSADSYSFIQDPHDRRVLLRYLNELDYLLNEYRASLVYGEPTAEFLKAIQQKGEQISQMVGRWGRTGAQVGVVAGRDANYPNIPGVVSSRFGNIHFAEVGKWGWYGNKKKVIKVDKIEPGPNGTWIVTGTYGRVPMSKTIQGTFRFVFTSPCSFKGTYRGSGRSNDLKWEGLGDCL